MAKIEWKTQDEIEQENAEQERIELLPTDRERLEFLENAVIELMMKEMRNE